MRPCVSILAAPQAKEPLMPESHRTIHKLRQIMIDGTLVLSFALLVTIELPL